MMTKAIRLLESMEVVPSSVLGGSGIVEKEALLKTLKHYQRVITITLMLLYVVAVALAIATVMLALASQSHLTKALLPYVGGAAFVGLLEFARRLTKEWMLITLPLAVAPHVPDKELSEFVKKLLTGVAKGVRDTKPSKGKTVEPS